VFFNSQMNKLSSFFTGVKVIEEVDSPLNGRISVIKSIGLGTYFQVGNLTQSGGVVVDIWRMTLNRIKKILPDPQEILILGLGGGSCAKLARKMWPYVHITGVDFDSTIIELGKKYFDLGSTHADIIVGDACKFIEKTSKEKKYYGLVIVDLYVGQEFPVVFESDIFLKNLKNILAQKSIVIFNRLYYGEKRPQVVKFSHKLERYFAKVDLFYPEANVMLICSK